MKMLLFLNQAPKKNSETHKELKAELDMCTMFCVFWLSLFCFVRWPDSFVALVQQFPTFCAPFKWLLHSNFDVFLKPFSIYVNEQNSIHSDYYFSDLNEIYSEKCPL